jgi:hypothetical protein
MAGMKEYRAYIMGPDGHVQNRVDLNCADDDAAQEQTKKLVDGYDIELWELGRYIATFKHEPRF